MACDAPLSIKYKQPLPDGNGGWIYYFPADCGKCLKCLIKRKAQWSYRMVEELNNSFSAYFVTLTYDDKHLTYTDSGNTINPFDHKQFIENLKEYEKAEMLNYRPYSTEEIYRKDNGIKEVGKLAYYGVSEYGGKTGRSHWHYILFNIRDTSSISLAWIKGRIQIDECNINTIDYVLKYMIKDRENDQPAGKKECSFMSKGIGMQGITEEFIKQISEPENNQVVNSRGHKVALPRIYRKRYLEKDQLREKAKYINEHIELQKQENEIRTRLLGLDPAKNDVVSKQIRQKKLKQAIEKRNKI